MKPFLISSMLVMALMLGAPPYSQAEALPNCDGTQGEMNQCAANLMKAEEQQLDALYQAALKQAGDDMDRKKLEASQKAWLAFRDAECVYESDAARGGSMEPLLLFTCRTTLTRARMVQLQEQYAWPADLSRLLSQAGDKLPQNVFWNPLSAVTGDFDHDGIYDDAYLGLIPGELPNPMMTAIIAVMFGDSDAVLHVRIPVDGQNGLCAPSVELRTAEQKDGPPMLVVDDGACDAFRFVVAKGKKGFELHRN